MNTFTAIQGDRYTQSDHRERNRSRDHLAALAQPSPLMALHGIGYDVSQAKLVEVDFDPYEAAREPELEQDAVLAVLDYFGHPAGRQAGGFVTSLLETMGRADLGNRAKLVAAFPEWGIPFVIAKDEVGGTARLAARFEV